MFIPRKLLLTSSFTFYLVDIPLYVRDSIVRDANEPEHFRHYHLVIGDSLRYSAVMFKMTSALQPRSKGLFPGLGVDEVDQLSKPESTVIYRVTGCSRMLDRTVWSANNRDRDLHMSRGSQLITLQAIKFVFITMLEKACS